MTPQEIYDTVSINLIKQKVASKLDDYNASGCAYRGMHGRKCAIGWLISDELYNPIMEGNNLGSIVKGFKVPTFFAENFSFIDKLRVLHDHRLTNSFEEWKIGMIALGNAYKLNTDVFKENV